jgi:hypothetical protein
VGDAGSDDDDKESRGVHQRIMQHQQADYILPLNLTKPLNELWTKKAITSVLNVGKNH